MRSLPAFWARKGTITGRETGNMNRDQAGTQGERLPENVTVAVTGASGAVFARALLLALEADGRVERVHFVASDNSLRVIAEELSISGRNGLVEKLLGHASTKITKHS